MAEKYLLQRCLDLLTENKIENNITHHEIITITTYGSELERDIFQDGNSKRVCQRFECWFSKARRNQKAVSKFPAEKSVGVLHQERTGNKILLLGDSVEKWIKESYDLELDIDNCRSELRKFQTFIFSSVRYKLYLDSMKNLPLNPSKKLEGKKHIADVYVIILDESFPAIMFNGGAYSKADFFKILQESETSNSSKTLNTIIAIKSVNTLLSKHFVITTNGDSGEFFSKYNISKINDKNTEYTLKE